MYYLPRVVVAGNAVERHRDHQSEQSRDGPSQCRIDADQGERKSGKCADDGQ